MSLLSLLFIHCFLIFQVCCYAQVAFLGTRPRWKRGSTDAYSLLVASRHSYQAYLKPAIHSLSVPRFDMSKYSRVSPISRPPGTIGFPISVRYQHPPGADIIPNLLGFSFTVLVGYWLDMIPGSLSNLKTDRNNGFSFSLRYQCLPGIDILADSFIISFTV